MYKLNTILFLILLYFINNSIGTNLLPLEVFEISSAAAVVQQAQHKIFNDNNTDINNNINDNNNNNNNNNNNSNISNNNLYDKNSNKTYININLLKTIYNNLITNKVKVEHNRRSSRQMLIKEKLLNDELLMPHRILYQVGESEEDLPICSPNAVCSKIDVYDIPWIERQCRCPIIYTNKIQIHHHHHYHNPHQNSLNHLKHVNSKSPYINKKYNLQQRHIFDLNGRNIEDIHIKKFMQKFQAVHRDDLVLSENDLQQNSEEIQKNNLHSAIPTKQQQQQHPNLFLIHKILRKYPQDRNDVATSSSTSYNTLKKRESNKLRHSGHFGQHHHRKDITFLGGCPNDVRTDDGFTISDKTRHYKLCSPVHKLPLCDSYSDFTWTVTTMPELNVTEQIVHCRCRPNSVTYLTKWEPNNHSGYTYYFACSPQNRLRCQRKEPCRLFTLRQRQEHLDEVNTNPLCQCPRDHKCPTHHTDSGVVAGESYMDDNIKTYAGYCMAND